jgi:hypothetical protein
MDWGEKVDNMYTFNTFSDLVNFDFKFDESVTKNENGFYNRFAKATGLDKFKKTEKNMLKRLKKKKAKEENNLRIRPLTTAAENVAETTETTAVQPEKAQEITVNNEAEDNPETLDNFIEQSLMAIDSIKSPENENLNSLDYIPLVNQEDVVATNTTPQKTDAKVFLSKIHSKILMGSKGSEFLKEAAKTFDLALSITFDKIGNVLVIFGTSENQNNFHNELVNYLNESEKQLVDMRIINQVPKVPTKVISFIGQHLALLDKRYGKVQDIYKRLVHFENGNNIKSCEKIRRQLNIVLFGQLRLRDGGTHLDLLNENVKSLESTADQTISTEFRDEIFQHIKYIFTSFNHNNYQEVVGEYMDNQRTEQQNALIEARNNDLILNVANEPQPFRRDSSFNLFFPKDGLQDDRSNDNRANYSNKAGNWRTRVPRVLHECKYLIKQLRNRSLAEKFSRTFAYMEQTRYPTYENFRQLTDILHQLKAHVNQKR